jgi:hypothetical protein
VRATAPSATLTADEWGAKICAAKSEIQLSERGARLLHRRCGGIATASGEGAIRQHWKKGSVLMKLTLSLAALALAGLLLAAPAAQAGALKLDGLHQGSLVETAAMAKKKKATKKKKKKKYAMKKKKKAKAIKRTKKKKR